MFQLNYIMTKLLDVLEGKSETAFMSLVILINSCIDNIVSSRFVDGVVCQMHIQIIQVALSWRFVFCCCKSAKPFLIEINSQGVNTTKQNINSQIKFQVVNQKWFMQISLNHIMFLRVKIFKISGEENSFALT